MKTLDTVIGIVKTEWEKNLLIEATKQKLITKLPGKYQKLELSLSVLNEALVNES